MCALPLTCGAQSLQPTPLETVRIDSVLTGLDTPWALAFLPDGGFLVSERGGRLLLHRGGRTRALGGVPEVRARGQGGLLDVVVARDFRQTREVFLSFAKPRQWGGGGTALARARLAADGNSLEEVRVIFEMQNGGRSGQHFGSRIVEAAGGNLFLTIGDRGKPGKAQSLTHHHGKVVRIARDGSIPPGNPFPAPPALPEIWSLGHRNPQGAALDLAGGLLAAEHGARGGDEINRIRAGANYGWPVIAYGRHYSGGKIGEGSAKPGMEQPLHYWDPSIAPSGMLVYSGKRWPQWRGDVFVGSLKFDYIARLDPDDGWREAGQIASPETARVRDVREAADGSIWFLSEDNGAVYRITPQ
ncbi:MAG: PQQ-dependent sugar dehydrogenase [Gammaproteobacteria bacterium]